MLDKLDPNKASGALRFKTTQTYGDIALQLPPFIRMCHQPKHL